MKVIDDTMKLMICFDDKNFTDKIKRTVESLFPYRITEINQCEIIELIESIDDQRFDYDIIFLDIQYCNIRFDGVSIGKRINKILPTCVIMYFVDDYDMIPKIYEVNHYCLCRKTEVDIWLEHFISRLLLNDKENFENNYLELISKRRHIIICQDEVEYIERKHRMIEVHTVDKEYDVYSSIKKINSQLNPIFERCHGSFIVNMGYVKGLDGDEILMQSGVVIPLGETYKKKFDEQYRLYIRNGI